MRYIRSVADTVFWANDKESMPRKHTGYKVWTAGVQSLEIMISNFSFKSIICE